jgi:hypothetical protein
MDHTPNPAPCYACHFVISVPQDQLRVIVGRRVVKKFTMLSSAQIVCFLVDALAQALLQQPPEYFAVLV